MKLTLLFGGSVWLFGTVFGDAATAAAIAGFFSTVNLVLNTIILKRSTQARREARLAKEAVQKPRRFVYDSEQRIIGSIADDDKMGTFSPIREGEQWHDQNGETGGN